VRAGGRTPIRVGSGLPSSSVTSDVVLWAILIIVAVLLVLALLRRA
jgi:hypothetical protein